MCVRDLFLLCVFGSIRFFVASSSCFRFCFIWCRFFHFFYFAFAIFPFFLFYFLYFPCLFQNTIGSGHDTHFTFVYVIYVCIYSYIGSYGYVWNVCTTEYVMAEIAFQNVFVCRVLISHFNGFNSRFAYLRARRTSHMPVTKPTSRTRSTSRHCRLLLLLLVQLPAVECWYA